MAKRSHAIILSPDAERDIDDIWDYLTTEASIRVADKTVRAMLAHAEFWKNTRLRAALVTI